MITIRFWVRYGVASGGWEERELDMTEEEVKELIKDRNYVDGDTFGSEAHIIKTS